jgi:putative ABC transport system permease protein
LDQVRARPEVEMASGRLHSLAILTHGEDRRYFDVLGVDPTTDNQLRPQNYGEGGPLTGRNDEMVVDASIAQVLHFKLGDKVKFAEKDNLSEKETAPRMLTVVGIIQRPTIELIARPTVFVSLASLAKDMGITPEYSVIDLKLKESAGIEDYDQYAMSLGKILGPAVEVTPGTTPKAKLSDLGRTLRIMLIILSTMSAFCAALIIGTTLSVGIQERIRQFGHLRCIGASRGQLVQFLLGDAAVMLIIGELIGAALGIASSAALVAYFPQFFLAYHISLGSLLIAGFCGALATMLGAVIPIWQVTRVSPMAAVTAVANQTRPGRVWQAAALGALCLVLQAGLWLLIPSRDWRFYTYVGLGIPLIFTGWCLLAPGVLVFSERFGAGLVSRLFFVRPSLLRHAWSRTPWRAGAMIAALMIGVTLFTAVRARGQSILISWTTPARIPDLIIKSFSGISDKRLEMIRQENPEFGDITMMDYFGVHLTGGLFQLGALFGAGETTFIAVDPPAMARMVELEYIQGDPATAVKQLTDGQHIFVSKEYHNVRKLGVGDKLTFRAADGKPVEFTIAAVVTSTGAELTKNFFDLRQGFSEQSVASVIGSLGDAHKYFKLGDPTIMLVNVKPEYSQPEQVKSLLKRLDAPASGLHSVSSTELKTSLSNLIKRIMNGMTVIALGALCMASLGVANMVIASIHAKRFEFGVLRAIGAGRWQLVRLVLAEVTLIGIVAGVLGAAAGFHFAFMATQIDWLLVGLPTSFLALKPVSAILTAMVFVALAILLTTLLAWLASLVPAIRGAVTAQRTLLASGRV